MLLLRRFIFTVLVFSAPLWAQSGSSSGSQSGDNPGSDSQSQSAPPSQAPPDADKDKSPNQTSPNPPPDSTQLEPIKTVKAAYPYEASEKQLQGQVVVKVLVSVTGNVLQADVVSGDAVFTKAAVEAAKQWKFKPFIRNGRPNEVSTTIPFNFAFSKNVTDITPSAPVQVSQGIMSGLAIHKVAPNYPPEAKREGIRGTVVLKAKISKEGRIVDLQLVSGPSELVYAARSAVEQWRYKPYLLNGEPVEVLTQIQVNFQLGGR